MGPYGPRGGGGGPPGGGRDENDGTNVYVGGLAPHVDDVMLRSLFSSCGDMVSANVIRDKGTGQVQSRSPKPETQNPKPETRNRAGAIPKPQTRNPKP